MSEKRVKAWAVVDGKKELMMRLFLLALLLDTSVLVFVTTAVWFAHGWFGILMYAIASIGANLLYLQARPRLLIIRKRHRNASQVDS